MFIFFALLFSLISLFIAFKCHDRYDPARYFLLIWGGQIILIYAVFHNMFTFTGYGLVYISMIALTFSMGSLTGSFIGNKMPEENNENKFLSSRSLILLQICFGLGILNVLLGINANGFNLRELFSFKTLLELNVAAADTRYTMNVQGSLVSQVTLIFVYLTPLYGGYLLPLLKGNKRIWCYLAILPALLISLTQAMKLAFIASIVLCIVGIIVSSFANNDTFLRVKKTAVLKLLFFVTLVFAVLFMSMMLRAGTFDKQTVNYMKQNFASYAFGQLPAFDVWFTNNIGEIDHEGGLKTFYGISNFFGLEERKQGVFTDYIFIWKNINNQIPSGIYTNVFTLFRFLLEDFGYIGSFLMIFFTGIISGFSWLMVKRKKYTTFFQTMLISLLFFVFMSFATSVWVYTSFIATVVIFYFLLSFTFSKQTFRIPACQKI